MPPNWPVCGQGIPACGAARVRDDSGCWAHLSPVEFEQALAQLSPGVTLDLRGTMVKSSWLARILDCVRDPATGQARLGSLRCDQAGFGDPISLCHLTVLGSASFSAASFGAASFRASRFADRTDFAGADFAGDAAFTDVCFGKFASFADATFGTVLFAGVRSTADVSFERATVATSMTLDNTQITGTLTLTGLHASGEVDIRAEAPAVHSERARFGGRVRLQLAGATLWLTDSIFDQPATVAPWPRTGLGNARSWVDYPPVALRSMRGVDAEHLTLSDTDLGCCLIYGLQRPDELRLAGSCRFAPTPGGWYWRKIIPWRWTSREALYEEHLWRRTSPTAGLGWTKAVRGEAEDPQVGLPPRPAQLAVLYRQLRQAVETARNEPGAADLYYGEMEMRRLSTTRAGERWLLNLYWLVSGYGLRASRAMVILAGVVLAAAEVLQRVGFGTRHSPGYLNCLLYAISSLLSLDLPGRLPAVLTDSGQAVRIVLRIGGPVLLGLAALAVRGRIKR